MSGLIREQLQGLVGSAHTFAPDDPRAASQRAVLATFPQDPVVAIVRPASVAEVQGVVRLAGTLGAGISVIPNAAGNGAQAAPAGKPAIALDLSRLNDIEELNTDSGYVRLGPGVSFDDLHNRMQAMRAPYWLDPDPNGANSVSGSVAERAFGFTPYGDHLLMQCGLEVVTANGEVVRTGMGALPGSDTWQLFKYNFGPYLDGLFSRSNFGIITQLGLWLMPAPPVVRPFMLALPGVTAVAQAIEILRPMKIGMVLPNTVVISDNAADRALVAASGGAPAKPARPWHLYAAIYGLEDNVSLIWETVSSALGALDGAEIYTAPDPATHTAWPLRSGLMRGRAAYRAVADRAPPGLWFNACAPMEAQAATDMLAIAADAAAAAGIDAARELQLTWRTLFMRVTIPFLPANRDDAIAFALSLIERLGSAGYAVSHDCAALTAAVHARQTAPPLRELYRAIGAALDPHGVLGGDAD
jgi:4-cresol dehydrogenase (hydroxylating)